MQDGVERELNSKDNESRFSFCGFRAAHFPLVGLSRHQSTALRH